MRPRRFPLFVVLPSLLVLSGCGYVHLGRLPAPVTTVVGDDKLMQENSELRLEKKILQQELALTRAQGDALRMAIENRAADGDTSKRLVEKLNETTRELAALRASYAKIQAERDAATALAGEASKLKEQLGATEEKLASSLRNYTELQEQILRLRGDVTRTRAENVVLGEQLKAMTAQNEQAQIALAQLNTHLLEEKETRVRAQMDVEALRTQLKTVAPESSVLAQLRTGTVESARSFSAEQAAENAALKQELAVLQARVGALEFERSRLQQQLAAVSKNAAESSGGIAPLEAKLSDALRHAAELRDENARLKASVSDTTPLQEQLRQIQAQAAALTDENARLKARLALAQRTVVPADTTRIELTDDPPAPANVGGVNATLVTSVSSAPRAAKSEASGTRLHVVAGGDTLAKISTQYYGTPSRWAEILAANRDVLGETNNLVVGRTLRIP